MGVNELILFWTNSLNMKGLIQKKHKSISIPWSYISFTLNHWSGIMWREFPGGNYNSPMCCVGTGVSGICIYCTGFTLFIGERFSSFISSLIYLPYLYVRMHMYLLCIGVVVEENRKSQPTWKYWEYIDSLAQDCGNSSADALALPQSCAKPSACPVSHIQALTSLIIDVHWSLFWAPL